MNALVREHGGSSERWVESSCGETSARGADAGIVASAIGPGDRTDDRRGAAQERRPSWARLANGRNTIVSRGLSSAVSSMSYDDRDRFNRASASAPIKWNVRRP